MKTKSSQIGLYYRTLKHIPLRQIGARLGYILRRLFYSTWLYPLLEEEFDPPTRLLNTPPHLWRGDAQKGQDICNNVFSFVGRTINMGNQMQWRPTGVTPLWAYHLHYFDWLTDLHACGDMGRREGFRLVEDWLLHCDFFDKESWHPYPLSLRIISWIHYYDWLTEGAKTSFKEMFGQSLMRQVNHLERNIEWDVGGNHLLKNLKALIYAGLCLPNKQTVYLEARDLFLEQIRMQILEDGMHYELSPHYHIDVLTDLLDVQAMIRKSGDIPSSILEDAIDRMASALAFLRYPDGGVGLFNDGTEGDRRHIDAVLARCGKGDVPSVSLEKAGYVCLKRKDVFLMLDAGKVCPDALPAHGHADTLSFELCLGDERVFVNQGTYAYQHKDRTLFRGASAHNTICVDGEDFAELWGHFRIGRRPETVSFDVKRQEGEGIGVDASHDGYAHLGVSVQRRVFVSNDGLDIRGEDRAESAQGTHRVTSCFHLAPGVEYQMISHEEACLTTPKGQKFTFLVKGARLYDAESIYAPYFGEKKRTKQLVLRGIWRHHRCQIKWAIKRQ